MTPPTSLLSQLAVYELGAQRPTRLVHPGPDLQSEQVSLGIHLSDDQILGGDTLVTHVPRELFVFKDLAGPLAVSNRPRMASVLMGAAGSRASREMVSFDHTLKSPTL